MNTQEQDYHHATHSSSGHLYCPTNHYGVRCFLPGQEAPTISLAFPTKKRCEEEAQTWVNRHPGRSAEIWRRGKTKLLIRYWNRRHHKSHLAQLFLRRDKPANIMNPEHHHANDGTFRPECARCKLERAAPELLAACRVARLQLTEIRQAVFDSQPVSNGWFEAALDRLELAIKKATLNPCAGRTI